MAHAQKPDLVFQRNGRVHLNWLGGQLLAAEVCASAVVMLDTPCSEVECETTGYPLHSHVSPSLPLTCVTVCHHIPTGLYLCILYWLFAGFLGHLTTPFKCRSYAPSDRVNIAKDDVAVTILSHCPIVRLVGQRKHENPRD